MNSNQYPLLKIKSNTIDAIKTEIELDGKPLRGVRGITFSSHVENEINLVTIELLSRVEIEAPVSVKQEFVTNINGLATYINGEKYRLVKVEEDPK